MTKKKAIGLVVLLIAILGVFVVLASLGGTRVTSPIPEEPKIIWIKPSLMPTPSGRPQSTPLQSSSPRVIPTVKPTVVPTTAPTETASPSPTAMQ